MSAKAFKSNGNKLRHFRVNVECHIFYTHKTKLESLKSQIFPQIPNFFTPQIPKYHKTAPIDYIIDFV